MPKRVLITGDDGYNSVGIRALVELLKDNYSVSVAATLEQQSGMGGKLSLSKEITWGEDIVEGAPALWVDGSPADAMEISQGFFDKPFDFIISGINYGENLSYALVSSGTFSAAIRGIGTKLAPRAIVMSWQTTSDNFLKKHEITHDLTEFLKYPGKEAVKIIDLIIKNNFYGKEIVNVNFPMESCNKYKIAKVSKDITKLWNYPLIIDKSKHIAKHSDAAYSKNLEKDPNVDIGALHNGFITISPIDYLK